MQDSFNNIRGYSPRIINQNSYNKMKLSLPFYQNNYNHDNNLRFQSNSPINKYEQYIRNNNSYNTTLNLGGYNNNIKELNNQKVDKTNMMDLRIGFDLLSHKIDKLNNIIKQEIEPKKAISTYLDSSQRNINNSNLSFSNYDNFSKNNYNHLTNNDSFAQNNNYNDSILNIESQNNYSTNYQNPEYSNSKKSYSHVKKTSNSFLDNLNVSETSNKYEKYIIGNQNKTNIYLHSYDNYYDDHNKNKKKK